jgi:(p)ppGpp synthase/HD superfamily hydrolase
VLRRFTTWTPELLEAAWLHDAVEDTGTKLKEVQEFFGSAVAHLVAAVTNEAGPNRKTRHALTYPKIREAGMWAVRLKLADRIANVEAGGNLVGMYRKEHEDFRRSLYTPGENEDMWSHLNAMMEKPNA